jgi:hypothetical protein
VNTAVERVAGICAVAGGTGWIAGAVYRSTLPRGCVAEECATRPMRGESASETILWVVSATLVILAGIGLLISIQQRGRLGRLGVAGILSCVASVLLLGTGLIAATYFPVFAENAMPAFVIPGIVLLAVGVVMIAILILRSRVLPRWAAIPLLIGAAMLLVSNEQTAAVLFVVPLGIAWVLVGIALWRLEPPARSG